MIALYCLQWGNALNFDCTKFSMRTVFYLSYLYTPKVSIKPFSVCVCSGPVLFLICWQQSPTLATFCEPSFWSKHTPVSHLDPPISSSNLLCYHLYQPTNQYISSQSYIPSQSMFLVRNWRLCKLQTSKISAAQIHLSKSDTSNPYSCELQPSFSFLISSFPSFKVFTVQFDILSTLTQNVSPSACQSKQVSLYFHYREDYIYECWMPYFSKYWCVSSTLYILQVYCLFFISVHLRIDWYHFQS